MRVAFAIMERELDRTRNTSAFTSMSVSQSKPPPTAQQAVRWSLEVDGAAASPGESTRSSRARPSWATL